MPFVKIMMLVGIQREGWFGMVDIDLICSCTTPASKLGMQYYNFDSLSVYRVPPIAMIPTTLCTLYCHKLDMNLTE